MYTTLKNIIHGLCPCFGTVLLALAMLRPAFAQTLPVPLAVGDSVVLLKAQASGVQVYAYRAKAHDNKAGQTYEWVFKAPEADLSGSDGSKIGRHYAGPTWEASDGSKVVGGVLASAASPANIPWLLLAAKSTSGRGIFSRVTYVERVFTSGGTAPQSNTDSAHVGTEVRVPYTATYIFYGH